jgi:uncharacterized protein YjiS (DUF1127 family)
MNPEAEGPTRSRRLIPPGGLGCRAIGEPPIAAWLNSGAADQYAALQQNESCQWRFSMASIKDRFIIWRHGRRQRARFARELRSCSNRDLFDLGISSGDIPAVVDGTYCRN